MDENLEFHIKVIGAWPWVPSDGDRVGNALTEILGTPIYSPLWYLSPSPLRYSLLLPLPLGEHITLA